MSFHTVSSFDGSDEAPAQLRQLDPVELRVVGSLLEKQQTTPEYYPLTVNALVAACNQKSSREPLMELSEQDVVEALDRLSAERLVRRVEGSRADRWQQTLDLRLGLDRKPRALLTLLLLRGAQTPGELRSRSERIHPFPSIDDVAAVLSTMAERSIPLVRELARRTGQKESRWMHLLGDAAEPDLDLEDVAPQGAASSGRSLAGRVEELERQLAELKESFEALRSRLGE